MITDKTVTPCFTLPAQGTFVQFYSLGIYLAGQSGQGKSDLALMLMQEGARLVCDDAPLLSRKGNSIYGECPKNFEGLMHIRDLGIINIFHYPWFRKPLVKCRLDLVLEVQRKQIPDTEETLLEPHQRSWHCQGLNIPGYTIPSPAERPVVPMIKMLIQHHIYKIEFAYPAGSDRISLESIK